MDTETFLLKRQEIEARLKSRRSGDWDEFAYKKVLGIGFRVPAWLRLGLSFLPSSALLGKLLGIGLPIVASRLLRNRR